MLATIPVELITVGTRLRDVSEAKVEQLSVSIADVGLINPITVYPRTIERRGIAADGYGIVAGVHRLAAIKRLGLVEIEASIVDLDELHRQLAEVDENLYGTTLGKAERALFTQRRKEIYEALHPETRATKDGGEGRHKETRRQLGDDTAERFTANTAASTGHAERTVQRDADRGSSIPDDVLTRIKGTHLDRGVFLDRIKDMDHAAMRALVKSELEKARDEIAKARQPKTAEEVEDRQLQALASLWDRTGEGARARFREYIDQPVFDRSRTGRAA